MDFRNLLKGIDEMTMKNIKKRLDFNFNGIDGAIRVTIDKKEIKNIVELQDFIQSEIDLVVSREQKRHLKEVENVLNKYSKSRTEGGLDYVKAFEEMEKYEQKLFNLINTK